MGSQAPDPQPFHVRSVAIIGAGASGLCAAKYLLAQGPFTKVVIYEKQPEVGGVWLHTSPPSPGTIPVPQVDPLLAPEPPDRNRDGSAMFPTPMYDVMHTNIQRRLMQFSDAPLPLDTLIYPSREDVQSYLVSYAGPVRDLIRFSTQVTRVDGDGRHGWVVETVSVTDGTTTTSTFDAVVVAPGVCSTPYMPPVPGLEAFHAAYPGAVSHSKQYRSPTPFTGQKVVVVGNGASGLDVAWQISRVCASPLLLSVRTASSSKALGLAPAGAEEVAQIAEFLVPQRGVRFIDGRVETYIDAVVFATGYLLGFPFLASVLGTQDGIRVAGLYRHVFHIQHPTLAFVGLQYRGVAFSLSQSQAALVARVWANELALPSAEAMREWEQETKRDAERRGVGFHACPDGGDCAYIKAVHDDVVACGSSGKMPPLWDDELIWERATFLEAKLQFEMQGRTARSLEELGFRFEPGTKKEEAAVEGLEADA